MSSEQEILLEQGSYPETRDANHGLYPQAACGSVNLDIKPDEDQILALSFNCDLKQIIYFF